MPRTTPLFHTVEPFEYSFFLIHRRTGRTTHCLTLDDALIACYCGETFSRQPDYLPHRFSIHPRLTPYEKDRVVFTGPQWHLCNHLGRPIEQHELEERVPYLPVYKSWTRPIFQEEEPEGLSRRLIRTKGSPLKIKSTRQHIKKTVGVRFYATVCPLYRHVRTQNERQQTHNHLHEWGEFDRMVRAARKKLPTYYDDALVASHHGEKSWKHHSKRRKQWRAK